MTVGMSMMAVTVASTRRARVGAAPVHVCRAASSEVGSCRLCRSHGCQLLQHLADCWGGTERAVYTVLLVVVVSLSRA